MKKTIKKVAVLALCVVMGTSVCACGSNNNEALYLEKIAQLEQELIDANKETQKQLDKIESLEKDLADANKKIEDAEKKEIKIDYQYLPGYDVRNGLDITGKNVLVTVTNIRGTDFESGDSRITFRSQTDPKVKIGDELVVNIIGCSKNTIAGTERFNLYYEILERR